MALTEEGGNGIPATMLVGPASIGGGAGMPYPVYMGGGGFGGGNNGGFGGDWGWVVLLILLIAIGGWGNNGGNNNGGGGFFGGGQPIVINDSNGGSAVQRGFDQAAVMNGITGIQSGVQNLSTQLCNCCADMAQTVNSGFANAETAANARQIANMQQAFAAQMTTSQGFNSLQSQLAQCCCDNRLATNDLKYTIATENCADRAALSEGIRDIITNQTASTQRILDQLCADKIDAKNEKIADLERQLTMANLNASQIAQTATIQRGQTAEVDALYQRLRDCPVPTMPVYGMTPIFTCPQNSYNGCGCGCGCNGGNNF